MSDELARLSDEEAAKRVQEGDEEVFGLLVDRYQGKLTRYGRRFLSQPEDIEDIVQDVFMKVYANLKSFDTKERFSPWIYRIAHNEYVNRLKKSVRDRLTLDLDALVAHPAYDDPSEAERDRREVRALIDRALALVSPKYREVLVLYYLEEMSYKEIADILAVPTSTVGIRLMRGKKALKEAYTSITQGHE